MRVQVKEVEGVVSGQLPSWLSGSLLVNGGGDYSRMQHMFDGYACVTKVKVEGGKAWGSQRYLSTEAYSTYKQQGGCFGWEWDREWAVQQGMGVWLLAVLHRCFG